MIFNTTGGGAALNFRVIGAAEAPANPQENAIWVNTATEVTGWVFSSTVPEPPVSGMVWFKTAAISSAAFNALKKNDLQVYPVSAKQYVNGAWADVTAVIFQGGSWVSFSWYLYDKGTYDVPFTKWAYINGITTDNADHVEMTHGGAANSQWGWWTEEKIDVTNYSKLFAEVHLSEALDPWNPHLGIYSAKVSNPLQETNTQYMIAGTEIALNEEATVYEVNLSAVKEGYIGVQGAGTIKVYRVWLA